MFGELKKGSSSKTLEICPKSRKVSTMNYPVLYQWTEEIANHFETLNVWQVGNVALFSLGVMKAQSSRQQAIARQVVCGERVDSAARRLRRFVGNKKFPLKTFFGELTRWVVGALPPSQKLTLLVDETKLGDRIGALVVGVAWEGRCIPLGWRCYTANSKAAYPKEGQVKIIEDLLKCIQPGIPAARDVVVLADRGIGTSSALCRAVADLGWKYLFRVNNHSTIRTETGRHRIASMVTEGKSWTANGWVFKGEAGIPARALALWEKGYGEPWALITNDDTATGLKYACRNWQEQSFRDLKSHGWQWEASSILLPEHMARFMVLLVVAYAWSLALGGHAVQRGRARPLQRHAEGQFRRHWSLFKEGLQFFFEVVLRFGEYLSLQFIPDTRLL